VSSHAVGGSPDLAIRFHGRRLVGIVGGMGPLASAELLRTIYHPWRWAFEQDSPRLLLWSDPMVVDRTAAIDLGRLNALREAIEQAVAGLITAGAERVVIACVTAHYVLANLPPETVERCISLVDIINKELASVTEPHLLLCSRGTARARIFERTLRAHPGLMTLTDEDQDALHREIYRLKQGYQPIGTVAFLRDLLPSYGVSACVAACTDLHLVTKAIIDAGNTEFSIIDPLITVATCIRDGTL
jgi:aspartate racemase